MGQEREAGLLIAVYHLGGNPPQQDKPLTRSAFPDDTGLPGTPPAATPDASEVDQPLWQSLIFRIGIAMAGMVLLAIASMATSIVIADTSRGDAAAINVAGSLRMRSYKLAALLQDPVTSPHELAGGTRRFEDSLRGDAIVRLLPRAADDPLRRQYDTVMQQWEQQMRPALARLVEDAAARDAYLAQVEPFVATIDRMVTLIQQQAERRIQLLRLLQGIALFLMLGLVFFTMYKLLTDVLPPLRELLEMVNRARRGDFAARVGYRGRDELGLLSHTFNLMAADLSKSYGELEQRVADKTAELTRSNRSLQLLYQAARQLGDAGSPDTRTLLAEAEQVIGLGPLSLCLTTANADQAYCRITSAHGQLPPCREPRCADCLEHSGGSGLLVVPVQESGSRLGVLLLRHPPQQRPAGWQQDLLEALAGHIATALSLGERRRQQHRLALMQERATIARELHDSLAQALSYLKIQIGRLQNLIDRDAGRAPLTEVAGELREGVSSAYRQLRELLGTFRLKVDTPGLEPALVNTVAEFRRRGDLDIRLDYQLGHCPLRPNEEIHVLQIVREALANVLHHAQARQADIQLTTSTDGEVEISVRDDGIGLPDEAQRVNHYGMAIMQERAGRLGGTLRCTRRRDSGGTEVLLRFRPAFVHDNHSPLTNSP